MWSVIHLALMMVTAVALVAVEEERVLLRLVLVWGLHADPRDRALVLCKYAATTMTLLLLLPLPLPLLMAVATHMQVVP